MALYWNIDDVQVNEQAANNLDPNDRSDAAKGHKMQLVYATRPD